jgi:hypothetical protein
MQASVCVPLNTANENAMSILTDAFSRVISLKSFSLTNSRPRTDPVSAVQSSGEMLRRHLKNLFTDFNLVELEGSKEQLLAMKPALEQVAEAALSYDGISVEQRIWSDTREASALVLAAIRTPGVEANPELWSRMVSLLNYSYGVRVSLEYAGLKPKETGIVQ